MVLERLLGWLFTIGLLLIPGAVATVAWTPLLASSRFRSLFEHLPPFDSLVVTYPLYGLAGSVPYVVGVGVAIALAGENGIWGPPILGVTLLVSVAYVIGLPILGALVFPSVGVDWDPNSYGLGTWALLAIGGFWYALIFAIPLVVLGIVLSLPGGW